jgi:hypothetical protein
VRISTVAVIPGVNGMVALSIFIALSSSDTVTGKTKLSVDRERSAPRAPRWPSPSRWPKRALRLARRWRRRRCLQPCRGESAEAREREGVNLNHRVLAGLDETDIDLADHGDDLALDHHKRRGWERSRSARLAKLCVGVGTVEKETFIGIASRMWPNLPTDAREDRLGRLLATIPLRSSARDSRCRHFKLRYAGAGAAILILAKSGGPFVGLGLTGDAPGLALKGSTRYGADTDDMRRVEGRPELT